MIVANERRGPGSSPHGPRPHRFSARSAAVDVAAIEGTTGNPGTRRAEDDPQRLVAVAGDRAAGKRTEASADHKAGPAIAAIAIGPSIVAAPDPIVAESGGDCRRDRCGHAGHSDRLGPGGHDSHWRAPTPVGRRWRWLREAARWPALQREWLSSSETSYAKVR